MPPVLPLVPLRHGRLVSHGQSRAVSVQWWKCTCGVNRSLHRHAAPSKPLWRPFACPSAAPTPLQGAVCACRTSSGDELEDAARPAAESRGAACCGALGAGSNADSGSDAGSLEPEDLGCGPFLQCLRHKLL